MGKVPETERVEAIVVGGGQAGLSVGYHLSRRGVPFLILDERARVGDAWRSRWESLHLFTPARFDGLDGMPFPAPRDAFPSREQMANYLETYATRFRLPIRNGVRVDSVTRAGDLFVLRAGEHRFECRSVVVAMSNFQKPKVPGLAARLNGEIVQIHSNEYRSPSQLPAGPVLIVGAGNSGAEIAIEVARTHPTTVVGPDTGHTPFRVDDFFARRLFYPFLLRVVFHRILTLDTRLGRMARTRIFAGGGPLIRIKPRDLVRAGVTRRTNRVAGVRDGRPVLDDGTVLEASSVIWCTGFEPGFSWIEIPVHGEFEPLHERGIVPSVPGLFFVGLHFLSAVSSVMIHGVGRDAERIAGRVASRMEEMSSPLPSGTTVRSG